MGTETVTHRIPVILPSAQSQSQPTWQAKDEQSRSSTAGDTISFARPSITTGAHMPWNTKTKASFGPPRAFNHLQTVPPITILNNKQEATKLVYSKDLEIPPESPFKLRSQISSCDEETIEKDTERFGITLASTNPNCLPESEPIEGNRLGSVEASSGVVQSHPQNDHDLNGPDSTHRMSQATYPEARSLREAEIVLAQKPNVKIEPVSGDWMRPVINLPKSGTQFGLDCSDINSIQAETIGMGLDRNGKAVDANIRSSSMYKCSGDSSLIQVSEAFQAPVCMDTFSPAQSPDDIEHVDGSSRSQSLGDNKRKHEVLAATDLETQIDRADGRDEYRTEQRALKRRLTNRASAIRATEKKAQELSKMEKQIERLQSEHSELHAKWKKQAKTCNELRQNLASTREKLKVQEDENYKLKSEMQFLRSNLAMLPSSPTSYESVSVQEGLPVQGASDSGYLGWNQEYPFPTGMPTQAEIAADLELDRQILTNSSGQEYLREWQMW